MGPPSPSPWLVHGGMGAHRGVGGAASSGSKAACGGGKSEEEKAVIFFGALVPSVGDAEGVICNIYVIKTILCVLLGL